ncbi:MAG: hypothetical protein AAF226_09540 [Verrucomicrobiota bacterium]
MSKSRPKTLAEVVQRVIAGSDWKLEVSDFLDEFYSSPNSEAVEVKPEPLADRVDNGKVKDAYVAAIAEHLCRGYDIKHPKWLTSSTGRLDDPHFSYDSYEGRMYLLAVSPPAFKGRNLFVPEDVLSRC